MGSEIPCISSESFDWREDARSSYGDDNIILTDIMFPPDRLLHVNNIPNASFGLLWENRPSSKQYIRGGCCKFPPEYGMLAGIWFDSLKKTLWNSENSLSCITDSSVLKHSDDIFVCSDYFGFSTTRLDPRKVINELIAQPQLAVGWLCHALAAFDFNTWEALVEQCSSELSTIWDLVFKGRKEEVVLFLRVDYSNTVLLEISHVSCRITDGWNEIYKILPHPSSAWIAELIN